MCLDKKLTFTRRVKSLNMTKCNLCEKLASIEIMKMALKTIKEMLLVHNKNNLGNWHQLPRKPLPFSWTTTTTNHNPHEVWHTSGAKP